MRKDQPFDLSPMPPVHGGPGSIHRIGELVCDRVGRAAPVLIVADPGLAPFGFADGVGRRLIASGMNPVSFDEILPDPTFDAVDRASALARDCGAVAIVGLGGGSALDLAKAVAVATPSACSLEHFALGATPLPQISLPVIAVPTTSGTGSEATRTAVLTDRSGAKLWLWGEVLKPSGIVLDPELTTGLPPDLTAATGLDALVHAIEAATNRKATIANSALALTAVRLVAANLPVAIDDPTDLAARSAMQVAACYAGAAIDNAGTAIAHAVGHALGPMAKLHHGRAVACAMAASLPWNIAGDDGRFGQISAAMGGSTDGAELPTLFGEICRRVGLSLELELGESIEAEQLASRIQRPENEAMLKANWRKANRDDLLGISRLVLGGR